MNPVANVFKAIPAQTTTTTVTPVESLPSLLECPVCGDYALPPILQCQNGHHLCARCRRKVARCPICRAPKNRSRNLFLDHLAEMNLLNCKYHSQGCSATVSIATKEKHEMSCEHGPCSCVLRGNKCSWMGPPGELVDHILSTHGFIPRMQEQNASVTAENFDSGQDFTWYALQTCHGRDFIVMLKKSSENSSFKHCFSVVVLVGSSKDAHRFQYRLQVSGSNHRLTLEARMKGIHSLVESAQSGDGLIFSTSMAEHFCCGGSLKMDVTISTSL
ncbi:hypothetical protein MRX96_041400 [Rhipicephalus microplus]